MHVRRTKLLLWSAVWLMAAAGAAVVAWGVLAPYDAAVGVPAAKRLAAPPPAATRRSVPPLEEFEGAWAVNLRRPLRDAPAAAPPVPAAATRPAVPFVLPPNFKLAGTVVEPGRSVALLQNAEGKIELKSIGEKVGAAEVIEIATDRVVVRHNGQALTLKLDKPRKG